MDIKYCIWDFNGTLLDDVEIGIISVNQLLQERDLPTLSCKEDYYKVFGFPIIDYYRRLGFDFEKEPYEKIAPLWVALYLENVKRAGLFSDVEETLKKIKRCGIRQIIISATEQNMLNEQLKSLGIDGFFDDALGLDNIHAGSKLDIAKEWRKKHCGKAIFIGDTDHDAETAKLLGAECYLVARGHQSREYLEEHTDAKIFDDLVSLIEYLKIKG
ncbi:MAG: HAD hydrolase-like protein [Clostridia bacterium]|nr:HAD hydrolase-like protein [Clostridia bacterium]